MLETVTNSMITARRSLYGQGLAFPPRVNAYGQLAWSTGEDNVRECLRVLLLTEPGERLMREEFGSGLRSFLFEPNTATTRHLITERISQAIERWEPRVAVETVTVEADPQDSRIAHIEIVFRMIAMQTIERLGMSLQLEG